MEHVEIESIDMEGAAEKHDEDRRPSTANDSMNQSINDQQQQASNSIPDEDYEEEFPMQNALGLRWVFGLNKSILGCVHNLSDHLRKEIFYVSGHIGVIYNIDKHQQTLLQGHRNALTCSTVSNDKRWIVTADSGKDSMIVIWDSIKGIPIKTIFDPHANGIDAVAISHDNMYIATLSKPLDRTLVVNKARTGTPASSSPSMLTSTAEEQETVIDFYQEIAIWEWTSTNAAPVQISEIPGHDKQTVVRFHPSDHHLVVTNGSKRVVFWKWDTNSIIFDSPAVKSKDFKGKIGEFTQSIFVPNSNLAASSTVDGDIILWSQSSDPSPYAQIVRSALKSVRVHQSSVRYMTTVGKYIVTGGEDGTVKFFDHQLRLDAWFEEFDAGPIFSVSFEKPTFAFQESYNDQASESVSMMSSRIEQSNPGTGDESEFKAPDFIVGTATALIISVKAEAFVNLNAQKLRGEVLVHGQDGPAHCLASHPKRPLIAIGSSSGHLQLWDYQQKRMILMTIFKNLNLSCMKFDAKGEYLACGFTNGVVKILDGNKLEELQSLRPHKYSIANIAFSHDSLYFAYTDEQFAVGICRWGHRDDDEKKPIEWVSVGRFKGHSKPVTSLQFGIVPFGDVARLMSIGDDCLLIEYDLEQSSVLEGVKVKKAYRIGQHAIPTSMLWTHEKGIIPAYKNEKSAPDKLMFATNDYKFVVYTTPDINHAPVCTRTLLCPAYGGPINRMVLIPSHESELQDEDTDSENVRSNNKTESKFMAYSTHQKVIGIVCAPIDGNPGKSMGLIAHSAEITDMVSSADGKYLFTSGGQDSTVNMWHIRADVLEQEAKRNDTVDAYVDLITGGKKGEVFEEIQQFFYYAQIKSQGEVTSSERKLTGLVPIEQVPNLMRALGFYASNYQIKLMLSELRAMLGEPIDPKAEKIKLQTDKEIMIDFDTFLKFYINHRPVASITKQTIESAFLKLKAEPVSGVISRDALFYALMNQGEKLTENEIDHALTVLLNQAATIHSLEDQFPASMFAEQLLGFTN